MNKGMRLYSAVPSMLIKSHPDKLNSYSASINTFTGIYINIYSKLANVVEWVCIEGEP